VNTEAVVGEEDWCGKEVAEGHLDDNLAVCGHSAARAEGKRHQRLLLGVCVCMFVYVWI